MFRVSSAGWEGVAVPPAEARAIHPVPLSMASVADQFNEPLLLRTCNECMESGAPTEAARLSDGGLTLRTPAEVVPAWVMVKVNPAIVSVPIREAELLFGATV